jgi:hypothetical protein
MVLTPSIRGVFAYRHETVRTHTFCLRCLCLSSWDGPNSHLLSEVSLPGLGLISWSSHLLSKVSPPIVMRRSEHGPISWSSHLLSEVSLPIVMRRFELGLISWPSHLLLRCLCSSSCSGLYLGSFHGPHTFCLRCLGLSSCRGLYLGSYLWPAHLLSEVSPFIFLRRSIFEPISWLTHLLVWCVSIRYRAVTSSFIGDDSNDSKILYHHVDLEEITAIDHIERELRCTLRNLPSRFLCLELLCLSAW